MLCCLLPFAVMAQAPIVLVVPFAAGGPTDNVARVLQKALSRELDRPVTITYKIGGGGSVASSYVTERNKNETTLLITTSSLASNAAINNDVTGSQFNLVPLINIGTMPLVLVVPQKSNLSNFKSWQALDPQTPINIGSGEFGTGTFFYNAMFQHKMKKNLNIVPYKGQGQLIPALIGGHVDAAFMFSGQAAQLIKNKQILPVAVAAPERLPEFSKVPTFKELGMKNLDYYIWYMLLTNQHMSADEQKKIQQVIMKTLSNQSDRALLATTGLDVAPQIVDQSFVLKEIHRYQELIKSLNLKVN